MPPCHVQEERLQWRKHQLRKPQFETRMEMFYELMMFWVMLDTFKIVFIMNCCTIVHHSQLMMFGAQTYIKRGNLKINIFSQDKIDLCVNGGLPQNPVAVTELPGCVVPIVSCDTKDDLIDFWSPLVSVPQSRAHSLLPPVLEAFCTVEMGEKQDWAKHCYSNQKRLV